MKFVKGNRVVVCKDYSFMIYTVCVGDLGTVVDSKDLGFTSGEMYTVQFDSGQLVYLNETHIQHKMNFHTGPLTVTFDPPTDNPYSTEIVYTPPQRNQCECGASSIGSKLHSSWCCLN